MANPSVTLSARIETAPILKQIRELEKTQKLNFQINERSALAPLGRIRTGVDQIGSSLDAANQRVLTFGASAFALGGTVKIFNEIVSSTIKVEKAILDINSVLGLSSKDLSSFKKELFDVARNASQSFDAAAKAALEFSRQGLGAEETVKRVNSALILSRLSGLDAASAVDSLTSAINGFSKEGLTSTQVINRLVAVDTKFAVSTKDLAEALSRVGSTAQDSGVTFNKLLGIITSAQQITARGGAVIGNAFKTIFTRIQRPEVLDQLESFGIAVRDLSGEALSADRILENLGGRFDSLTKSQQQVVGELSAGIYQINQFRAIITDLARSYSVVEQATYAASSATVEAQKRNEALNRSLDSLIQNFKTSSSEIGDSIGKITIAPLLEEILSGNKIISTFLDAFRGAGKDPQIQNAGEAIAGGFLKGIGNILSGPGIVAIGTLLSTVLKKTFSVVRDDVVGLFPGRNKELDAIRGLNVLLASASAEDKTRLSLVTGIVEKEKIILEILAKQNALRAAQNTQQAKEISSLGKASPSALSQLRSLGKSGVFAGGYSPIQQEMSAIKKGVGGASPSAKPVVMPNFNFGKGKRGTAVVNTDEYVVPNYAFGGTAVFNKNMVKKMGLPSGARKINAAGGFVPNFAKKTPFESQFEMLNKFGHGSYKNIYNVAALNSVQGDLFEDKFSGMGLIKGIDPKELVLSVLKRKNKDFDKLRALNTSGAFAPQIFDTGKVTIGGRKKEAALIERLQLIEYPEIRRMLPGRNEISVQSNIAKVLTNYLKPYLEGYRNSGFAGQYAGDLRIPNLGVTKSGDLGAVTDILAELGESTGKPGPYELRRAGQAFNQGLRVLDAGYLRPKGMAGGFVPNFAPRMSTLYRGMSSVSGMEDSSKFKSAAYAGSWEDIGSVKTFDDLMNYLADSRVSTKPGVIPTSKSFRQALSFAAVEKSKGKKFNKLDFGDKIGASDLKFKQAIIVDQIRSDRIYSNPQKLEKLFNRLGSEKFMQVASGGKIGVSSDLLKRYFNSIGNKGMADIIGSYSNEKEVSLFNSLSDKARLYSPKGNTFPEYKHPFGDVSIASGYIPNFANERFIKSGLAEQLGSGVEGTGYRLGKTNLVTKKFNDLGALRSEYVLSKMLANEKIEGMKFLPPIGSLKRSLERGYYAKKEASNVDYLRKLSENGENSDIINVLSRFIETTARKKIDPTLTRNSFGAIADIHSGNYGMNERAKKIFDNIIGVGKNRSFKRNYEIYKKLSYLPLGGDNFISKIGKAGGRIDIFDPAYFNSNYIGQSNARFIDKYKLGGKNKTTGSFPDFLTPTLAGGHIPNFANIRLPRAQLADLLKSKKFQSIYYTKKNGESANYNAAQWRVNQDQLVGADAPKAYESWTDYDEKTNSIVLNSLKEGQGKATPRRFLLDNISRVRANGNTYDIFANGYVPNFADPLHSAISREVAAGVNLKDIYIDKDNRVKSSSNPMGLLVANRRDEPFDGSQGVSRALKEGINPRTYGAANGFVPNFAEFDKLMSRTPSKMVGTKTKDVFGNVVNYGEQMDIGGGQTSYQLRSLFRALRQEGTKSVEAFKQTTKEILDLSQSANLVGDSLEEIKTKIGIAGKKLVTNLTIAGATRAAELKQADQDQAKYLAEQAAQEARSKALAQQFAQAKKEIPQTAIPSLSPSEIARNKQIQEIQSLTPQQIEAQKEKAFNRIQSSFNAPAGAEAISANKVIQSGYTPPSELTKQLSSRIQSGLWEGLAKQLVQGIMPKSGPGAVIRGNGLGSQTPQTAAFNFPRTPQEQANVRAVNAQQAALASKQRASQLLDPTFREMILKKQVTGLSDAQLADMTGGGTGSRIGDINKIRGGLTGRSYDSNTGLVNSNLSGLVVGLAKSGTLATDFNETVQNLILKGKSLGQAYEEASNDLIDAGGSNSQLTRAQLNYAYSLADFEKEVKAQKASLSKQIKNQQLATRVDKVGISGLTRKEGSSYFASTREGVSQQLFPGIDPQVLANNKEAQKQITIAAAQRYKKLKQDADQVIADKLGDDYAVDRQKNKGFFGFGNEIKKAEKYISSNPNLSRKAQASIRSRAQGLQSMRADKISNAGFAASVALPLLSGFVPEGRGGSAGGIAGGIGSGALSFAGTGALIGSAIAPGMGSVVGLGIGAVVGGVIGAIGKLKVNFEEFSRGIEDNNAVFARQIEAANGYVQLQQRINDAINSGASIDDIKNLQKQQFSSLRAIKDPETRKALLEGGSDVTKLLKGLRPLSEGASKTALAGDVVSSLVSARGDSFFSSNFTAESISDAAQALASATDLSKKEVSEAFSKFRNVFQDDPLKAFKEFAPSLGLSASQIKETIDKLKDSPDDLEFIFRNFVANVDSFNSELSKSANVTKAISQIRISEVKNNLIAQINRQSALSEISSSSISRQRKDVGLASLSLFSGLSEQDKIARTGSINQREIQDQGSTGKGRIINDLKASLVEISKTAVFSGESSKQIENISSTEDINKLIETIGKGNENVAQLLKNASLQLEINAATTQASLKEDILQTKIMSVQSRVEQRNRILANSTFNPDVIQSFMESSILGRTKGASSSTSQLSNISTIDALGLPETEKSTLVKEILRTSSAKDTYSEILSSIIGEQVKPDEASIREAVNKIASGQSASGQSYDVFSKITAERISLGLNSINSKPQNDLLDLSSGKTDVRALAAQGKISFDTGALATKLDPLKNIETYVKITADFFKDRYGKSTSDYFGILSKEAPKDYVKERNQAILNNNTQIEVERDKLKKIENARLKFTPINFGYKNQYESDNSSFKSFADQGVVPNPQIQKLTAKEKRAIEEDKLFTAVRESKKSNLGEFLDSLQGKNPDQPVEGVRLNLNEINSAFSKAASKFTSDQEKIVSAINDRIKDLELKGKQLESYNMGSSFDAGSYLGLGQMVPNSPLIGANNNNNSLFSSFNKNPNSPLLNRMSGIGSFASQTSDVPNYKDEEAKREGEKLKLQEQIADLRKNAKTDSKAELDISKAKEDFYTRQLTKAKQDGDNRLGILAIERNITDEKLKQARLEEKSGRTFGLTIKQRMQEAAASMSDLSDVANTVFDSFQSRAGNSFGDFVTGATNAKNAFRDFIGGVLNDTARAFASKSVQQFIGVGTQAFFAAGGPVQKYASGGPVQALLTKGEYYISPKSANSIGRDTLDSINNGTMKKYASGGKVFGGMNFVVNHGSGVKDDVAATLQSGGYVIKKSSVEKYGQDYIQNLAEGKVQKRFIGGLISGFTSAFSNPAVTNTLIGAGIGAAVGGVIGYATAGKKGILPGVLIGGAVGGFAGYLYGAAGPGSSVSSGSSLKPSSTSFGVGTGATTSPATSFGMAGEGTSLTGGTSMSNFSYGSEGSFASMGGSQTSSVASGYTSAFANQAPIYAGRINDFSAAGTSAYGLNAATPTFSLKEAFVNAGLAGAIGFGAQALQPKPGSTSIASIPAGAKFRTESEMKNGEFAFLEENPQGGYTLAGYAGAPATRRYSRGGMVSNDMPLASALSKYANGGEVSSSLSLASLKPVSNRFQENNEIFKQISNKNINGTLSNMSMASISNKYSNGNQMVSDVSIPSVYKRYANGGEVSSSVSLASSFNRYAEGGEVSDTSSPISISKSENSTQNIVSSPSVYIKIDINNNGQMSSDTKENKKGKDSPFGEGFAEKMSREVRNIVRDEMVQQSRVGGINSQIRRVK